MSTNELISEVLDGPVARNGVGPDANVKRPTDAGNAARFAEQHCDKARYVPGIGWHVWDGRRWARDATGAVERLARETARGVFAEAHAATGEDARKALGSWALKSESEPRLRACLTLAATEEPLIALADELDSHPWLLNVANGTLDLRTGELRAHDRGDRLTKLADTAYDPGARSERWERFLVETTGGDVELLSFLRRAAGYTLAGDPCEEVVLFAHGPAAAGKSTFVEALRATLGDYATTADFGTFLAGNHGVRNDLARLAGARMVLASEVVAGSRFDAATLKAMTGRDTIAARFLYREAFEYRPAFTLWLAANDRPAIDADDDAAWRRMRALPFLSSVPAERRDPDLKRALTDDPHERAAVLAWAVRGCLEWQHDGFAPPASVTGYTDGYRRENDPLADWLAAACQIEETARATGSELRRSYERWCTDSGDQAIDTRAFAAALRSHGCRGVRTKSARVWLGIALKVTGDA